MPRDVVVVNRALVDAPTELQPSRVQPFGLVSAPSENTVVAPAVIAISSTKIPSGTVSELPCAAGSVEYLNRRLIVWPAYVDRSKVAGTYVACVPSIPLPSTALVLEPGNAVHVETPSVDAST